MDNTNLLTEKNIRQKAEKIDKNEEQWKNIDIISILVYKLIKIKI